MVVFAVMQRPSHHAAAAGDVSLSSGHHTTTTTASSASSITFPVLDEATVGLIDAIIGRVQYREGGAGIGSGAGAEAGAARSEWKTVLRAYEDEFAARGWDGQGETVVYGLLLRLGMERGTTWADKWAHVKRQQGIHADHNGHRHARNEEEDGEEDAHNRIFSTPRSGFRQPTASGAASASATARRQHQQRLTCAALTELQDNQSPYKKNLPGILRNAHPHAQDHGTPLAAQTTRERRHSQHTLPGVTFASDVDEGAFTHSKAARRDIPETPTARSPALSAAFPTAGTVSLTPSPRLSLTPETRAALFSLAERSDALHLARRFLRDWAARARVLQQIEGHTHLARQALLQRRALHFWRDRVGAHNDVMKAAHTAHERGTLRKAFDGWRSALEKRRRREWEKGMGHAYRTVVRAKERKLKEQVIHHWYDRFLSDRSTRFRRASLLRTSLTQWLTQSARRAELEVDADRIQEERDRTFISDCLEAWKFKTVLVTREADLAEKLDMRLAQGALAEWRGRLHDVRLASKYRAAGILRTAISRWRSKLADLRALEGQSIALSEAREEDVLDRYFSHWRLREHDRLLHRARRTRLLKRTWDHWHAQHSTIAVIHTEQATALMATFDKRSLSMTFARWRESADAEAKALRLASSLSSRLLLQRSLSTWRTAYSAHRLEARKARVARQFFLQRACLHIWQARLQDARAANQLQARDASALRAAFGHWRALAKRSRREAVLIEGIGAAIAQRITSDALHHWTRRVIDIRARELSVGEGRRQTLLSGGFGRWRARMAKVREGQALVESFCELKEVETLDRYWKRWSGAVKRNRTLRSRLEDKLEADASALLIGVFERWHDRYRESQLQEEEEQVLRYRQHQALKNMFGRWQSRTMALPAIQYNAGRLRSAFLLQWRRALPGRIMRNEAVAFDASRLLRATFNVWEEARRARAARRAANRFKAFASNTPLRPALSPSAAVRNPFSRRERLHVTPATVRPSTSSYRHRSADKPVQDLHSTLLPGELARSPAALPSFSSSRLRRELTPTRNMSADVAPVAHDQIRRRVEPASIALPPSSSSASAAGRSRTSSSAARSESDTGHRSVSAERGEDTRHGPESHAPPPALRRRKSEFEEGILREMRERLAAAGLSDRFASRNHGD